MKRRFPILILLLMPLAGVLGNVDFHQDIQLLSSTPNQCEIAYKPPPFTVENQRIEGRTYQQLQFFRSVYFGNPGEPQLPSRVMIVGIPPESDVHVTLVQSDFTEQSGVRLMPHPFIKKEQGLPQPVYKEGFVYSQSGFYPQELFKVEVGNTGGQRIARIIAFPVQFDPSQNKIRQYQNMVFQVHFKTSPDVAAGRQAIAQPSLVQKILLNPSQFQKRKRLQKKDVVYRPRAGSWHKIPVTNDEEGIFKITGRFLEDHGISIEDIEPSTLKIFNNRGQELPQDFSAERAQDFIEIPTLLQGADDGTFSENDAILFYGHGVQGWKWDAGLGRFVHFLNHYTNQNIYWLVFNDGQDGHRVEPASVMTPQSEIVTTFIDRFFLEQEINNPLQGGIYWMGRSFTNITSTYSQTFPLRDAVTNDTLQWRFRFSGETSGIHQFAFNLQEQFVQNFSFNGPPFSAYGRINLSDHTVQMIGGYASGQNRMTLTYQGSDDGSSAFIDWFEVVYRRSLRGVDGFLRSFAPRKNDIVTYQLEGFGSEPVIWDVTDPTQIRSLESSQNGGGWLFTDSSSAEQPKRYVAAVNSAFLEPNQIEETEMPDLRNPSNSADYIIITPSVFSTQAQRLKSLREENDTLSVFIADLQDVYDDFGWGLKDPTAIRDFVRYAYENGSTQPSYLLLFGDGHYDYRNIYTSPETNHMPPYEYDGLTDRGARASDDWYVYVDGDDSFMDLAVGRIPAQTLSQAEAVVDKIVQYETDPLLGDWRSVVTITADDEKSGTGVINETVHTVQSEDLAESYIPKLFNLNKIYLTEYPEENFGAGRRKSGAHDDLIDQFNRGTLIVNYIGHGNHEILTHEYLFNRDDDLQLLNNGRMLPLFYAATCAFGWYDNPNEQSFSEEMVNAEGRGVIAAIAASRFCSSGPNESLNKSFYNYLFQDSQPGNRLGDALRMAKLAVPYTVNNEMYHILGDPAMHLGVPKHQARMTQFEPGAFKALGLTQIEGDVEKDQIPWTDFQGSILVKGFDSQKETVYTTEVGTTIQYVLPGNALFRGESPVEQGGFQAAFVIPKDISYGGTKGRIHGYFWNGATDGVFYQDDISVGGSEKLQDAAGPTIAIGFDGLENVVSGDMIPEDAQMIAEIKDDSSGINITGEIGHKIMLTLDEANEIDMTDYFQYNPGSYLEGKLLYTLPDMSEGPHSIYLKVWDNANNSSVEKLDIVVVPDDVLRIEDVLNYPNPLSSDTHFTFRINQDAEIKIKIFTISGRLIKEIDGFYGYAGFNKIFWDGLDEMDDIPANGVYLYKLIAKAMGGEKALQKEVIGRLMIMR